MEKKEKYTDHQKQIALFARAFAHPARVAIIEHLFNTGTCICGDIVDEIGLAQPTISQHLKELKFLGLIQGNVDGTKVCYCIDAKNWNKMKDIMQSFINQDLHKITCC